MSAPWRGDDVLDGEKALIVLVAAKDDLLRSLRPALEDTNLASLCAQRNHEAISLLERLTIIDLELPNLGGWDLVRQITWHASP